MISGRAPASRNAHPSGGAPNGPVSNAGSGRATAAPRVERADAGERLPGAAAANRSRHPRQVQHEGHHRAPNAAPSIRGRRPRCGSTSREPTARPIAMSSDDHDHERHERADHGQQQAEPDRPERDRSRRVGRRPAPTGSSDVDAGRAVGREPAGPGQRRQHPRGRGVEEQAAPRAVGPGRCTAPGWRRRRRRPPRRPGASRSGGPAATPRGRRSGCVARMSTWRSTPMAPRNRVPSSAEQAVAGGLPAPWSRAPTVRQPLIHACSSVTGDDGNGRTRRRPGWSPKIRSRELIDQQRPARHDGDQRGELARAVRGAIRRGRRPSG